MNRSSLVFLVILGVGFAMYFQYEKLSGRKKQRELDPMKVTLEAGNVSSMAADPKAKLPPAVDPNFLRAVLLSKRGDELQVREMYHQPKAELRFRTIQVKSTTRILERVLKPEQERQQIAREYLELRKINKDLRFPFEKTIQSEKTISLSDLQPEDVLSIFSDEDVSRKTEIQAAIIARIRQVGK